MRKFRPNTIRRLPRLSLMSGAWIAGPADGRRLLDRLSECLNDLVPLLPSDNTAGILVIDPAGHIVQADARLRAITGNAEGTLPGAPALTLFAEDGRATLQAMLFAAIQGSPLPDTLATWIGT